MFSFFKNFRYPIQTFAPLATDMHSHLLPGIDDGAKTVEDSIRMIRGLMDLGFKRIITTPHILEDYYPNTPATIKAALEEVQHRLKKENISIPLSAAAEYNMDETFEELLQAKEPLLTLPGNRVLVEVSTLAPNPKVPELIFQLRTLGYQPVLAHPERYVYYDRPLEKFKEIKGLGCELQINLLSVIGHYGKGQQRLGLDLVKNGLVDFVGTDMHHQGHLDLLRRSLKDGRMLRLLNRGVFLNGGL